MKARSGLMGKGRAFDFKDLRIMELTVGDREELAGIVKPIDVPRGSVIMREGEIGDTMYFFARGVVEVTQRLTLRTGRHGLSQAEKSVVKLDAEKAPFFGDMAMFEEEPRSATITASTECLVYEVSRADFEELCQSHPALGIKLVRGMAAVLCQRLRRTNQDVLKLTTALSLALSR
jgi:CRP/FNR family cyclic AMP-dependent transcriptional regulator